MSDVAGALVRASGLVAAVVAAVALISGFLFSARETGERRRPAWWLDLHRGLGGLALAVVGLHVVVAVLDSGSGIGVIEAVIPGAAATERYALAWGVIATYLLAAAVFTTWPKRIANRRLWRWIHLSSTVGVVLSLVHGQQMGTDAGRLGVQVGLVAIAAPITYAVVVRAVDAMQRAEGTKPG